MPSHATTCHKPNARHAASLNWAAWYNTWLLIVLMPKGGVFPFLFCSMPDIPVSARILLMTAPRGPMSFPILSWGTTTDPILLVTSLASCSRSSSATTIRLEGKLKYVHNMPKTKQRLGSQSGSTATAFIHESDMLATKDMTTAHYQSNILTQADPQADRDIDAQTDVVAPPPPLPAQIA